MNDKLKLRLTESMLLGVLLAAPAGALADPVVTPGGKPGVATSWAEKNGAVTLVIAGDFDPASVAESIKTNVAGAHPRVAGKEVVVSGLPLAQLLTALEKVDVARSGDDIDAMLQAIQAPGGNEEGSGSSIRATAAADFADVVGDRQGLVIGKVTQVRRAQYPLVFVTVKITKLPKDAIDGLKKGATITVLPRVKSKAGVIDMNDKASKLNVGAWYAQSGDTVALRLEKPERNDVWVASAFERQEK